MPSPPRPDAGDRPRRLGIFGGTFDPVHVGHLVAAQEARHELDLDRVLMVVANEPWQKAGERPLTPADDRYAVVAAACASVPGLEASRLEIDRGGPSYTADTVEALRGRYPATELYLIVGSDVAGELATWRRVEELPGLVTLVVVARAGSAPVEDPPGWKVVRLEIPALEISSSDLRRRLATGRPVDFLVPESAIRCIRSRGLYAVTR